MDTTQFPIVLGQFGGGSASAQLLFFAALFAIMYFVLIRPQQKQAKEQQAMLSALKKGDDVVTQSGFLGKIFAVEDKTVMLEIASGVKVRVLKSAISQRAKLTEEGSKADDSAKKEEK